MYFCSLYFDAQDPNLIEWQWRSKVKQTRKRWDNKGGRKGGDKDHMLRKQECEGEKASLFSKIIRELVSTNLCRISCPQCRWRVASLRAQTCGHRTGDAGIVGHGAVQQGSLCFWTPRWLSASDSSLSLDLHTTSSHHHSLLWWLHPSRPPPDPPDEIESEPKSILRPIR